jgi:hypothetical protein
VRGQGRGSAEVAGEVKAGGAVEGCVGYVEVVGS